MSESVVSIWICDLKAGGLCGTCWVTLAHLKDKPTQEQPQSSSNFGVSSGVRSTAARLLGGNGSKNLVLSKKAGNSNFDGKGTCLGFNVGDTIFVSDLNSRDKDPIKSIDFSNSKPVCHAFDPDAKEELDLLIGLNSRDVFSVSLWQQLQHIGKKLIGAQHYNKDGVEHNEEG
ncbi:hypothetical protein T459_30215 [Capsicum annuum]|uniref:Uncharacterized protein n=1 Tax=Capsicum annuum TaxID=4072 RepID=A0A2G2Y7S9_CAPAN|nr:hypothetical protein T459_30215 [Capsicum annuum]